MNIKLLIFLVLSLLPYGYTYRPHANVIDAIHICENTFHNYKLILQNKSLTYDQNKLIKISISNILDNINYMNKVLKVPYNNNFIITELHKFY